MSFIRRNTLRTLLAISLLIPSAFNYGQEPAEEQTLEIKWSNDQSSVPFQKLMDEEWEWNMKTYPDWATYVGDPRYNDRWTDMSMEAIESREVHERELLAKIEAIKRNELSAIDKVNFDLFLLNAKLSIEEQQFPGEYLRITQMGGVHQDVPDMAQSAPKATVKDVEDFIKRLTLVPEMVDQNIALMRKGMETGVTPPKEVLGNVEANIRSQIVANAVDSPIYTTYFTEFPASIPESEHTRLRNAGTATIREHVIPAFTKLADFWTNEYYPKTRGTIGASGLPNGAAWYAFNVRRQTTTNMTPEQIHELGLKEVARIRAEMESIKKEAGFTGDLTAFFQFLRTDKQFFYTKGEDLLTGYRDIAKRADAELPHLFRTLPRLPYGVIPVPEYSQKTQTTAYYNGGSLEAGRPGYFYANLYDLPSRPKWEMEALTLHEAVPGHHLQIAIAQELGELPKFRQHGHYTAFVEGWGLYSESLGEEMGFYKDPYSKFGQLTYEMWRAIRLVVDTGMHAKGWTRQQAIDFFTANAGKAEHDIEVEVDRYIVWPGQALAYKIGELKIKELRAYSESELGSKFNVRDFHDQVLNGGALPLEVLEKKIKDWVATEKTR